MAGVAWLRSLTIISAPALRWKKLSLTRYGADEVLIVYLVVVYGEFDDAFVCGHRHNERTSEVRHRVSARPLRLLDE